jgi:dihydrofolate reductase
MRKLIVSMNVTLDNLLSGPDCEMDWHFKYWSVDMGEFLCTELSKADTVLMGRATYDVFSRFANRPPPFGAAANDLYPFFDMLNQYRKIVFSRTIQSPSWKNTTVIRSDLKKQINQLRSKEGKNIMVYGSAKLLSALQAANLVDEYQLWIHPVFLGSGKPLFQRENGSVFFKQEYIRTFSSGVVMMHLKL